jgi:tetratricopeptide (TPR) repeat protein
VICEAELLSESLNNGEKAAAISIHKSHVLYQLGRVDEGVQEGKKAVALATRTGQQRLVIGANALLGMAYFFRGDLQQTIETTLPDVDELRSRYRHALFETTATSSVNWLGDLAGMHAVAGQFDAAIGYAEEACAISEETQKPFDKAMASGWFGYVLAAAGRPDEAIEQLEPALALATSHQLAFLLPWFGAHLGLPTLWRATLSAAARCSCTPDRVRTPLGSRSSEFGALSI